MTHKGNFVIQEKLQNFREGLLSMKKDSDM